VRGTKPILSHTSRKASESGRPYVLIWDAEIANPALCLGVS
jgi:hypothetical protein